MAKKGVYKITGNTHPKTGEKTVYTVTEWYPDTPNSDRREVLVTWELFKKNDKGQFVTTHLKKKGVGEFTFGEQAYQSTFRVEGYLHSPEGKEPMAIIVHPQKNDGPTSKEKDILGVRLTYQDGSTITKALSYMDRLHATVKCQNLEGHYITLSLWEDDEKHEGHNKKNQFITKSPLIRVDSKGYARWNFTLLSTYISIANKREDNKKQHEYYILAEYNGKLQASDNVNVNNPEYKIPPPPSKPAHAKKPQPKPDTPKGSTHQSSRNNQPDKKGIIKKITLVDKDGKPFKRRPTFGQTIKLIIEAENVVGKKYNLKLWEHDSWGGDDLLYNNTHTFKADRQEILIPLTDEMQTIGEIGIDPNNPNYGEYWTGNWQEIYAEVTLLYISTKSPIINVDIEEKPKVLDNGRSPWKKEKNEVVKEEKGKCPRCKEKITIAQIENLFGIYTKQRIYRQEIIDNLNKYIFDSSKEIHINTCLRKAHFFAQVGAETLGMNPDWMVETDVYRYSKNRCFEVFGERAKNLNAKGLLDKYCMDNPQERLLNYLYAHENGFGNGNRNEASGDGYIYRGRGLKQLTGKENYKNASQYIKEYFPNEYIDLVEDPDKVKTAKYAALSAIAYWEKHEIWKVADTLKVSNDENIKKIRKIVNPGLAGWKDAKSYFEKGISVFLVNNCTPVKKENSKSKSEWHDPIDYSQRTYYNSSGAHKEQNGAFGPVRTKIVKGNAIPKNHQGLDIFANINTPCKACLDGKIVSYTNEGSNGYGNVLVLEVNGDDLRKAKRDYKLEFSAEKENGSDFNMNADKFYLRYAHLKSAVKTSGEVDAGDTICFSGDSGNANGVPNPHLHFEIAMKPTKNGSGLTNRYNPAFFVRLKPIVQKIQDDVKKERTKK